jgi:hypothetical protein
LQGYGGVIRTRLHTAGFGRSVTLLLAFASTVIPGFSLLEIHDQDFQVKDKATL